MNTYQIHKDRRQAIFELANGLSDEKMLRAKIADYDKDIKANRIDYKGCIIEIQERPHLMGGIWFYASIWDGIDLHGIPQCHTKENALKKAYEWVNVITGGTL